MKGYLALQRPKVASVTPFIIAPTGFFWMIHPASFIGQYISGEILKIHLHNTSFSPRFRWILHRAHE